MRRGDIAIEVAVIAVVAVIIIVTAAKAAKYYGIEFVEDADRLMMAEAAAAKLASAAGIMARQVAGSVDTIYIYLPKDSNLQVSTDGRIEVTVTGLDRNYGGKNIVKMAMDTNVPFESGFSIPESLWGYARIRLTTVVSGSPPTYKVRATVIKAGVRP